MINKNFIFTLLSVFLIGCGIPNEKKTASIDFNFDWEFKLQDSEKTDWKSIRLPHDWSVEHSFDSIKGEGATGYLPGGIRLYQKKFSLNLEKNQVAYILFDGVYNNAKTTLNGKELGFHPYGYSPFYYDISSYLNSNNEENLIELHVDRTRYADSRWYTGSGIYRNVKLITKNKLHIPIWGTFITTPEISKNEAKIAIAIKVKNVYNENQSFKIETQLFNSKNEKVGEQITELDINSNSENTFKQEINIVSPELWNLDNPALYKAVTNIIKGNKTIDIHETPFGIRSILFDINKGFFLNGENMKIKGVCLHHDGGLVGAAVPKDVWKRRLNKLREAGCNAIRIAHNPASQEFLDLCDTMGFLVQDEFFDEWDNPKDKRKNKNEESVDKITRGYGEHFQEWAEKDLKNTMLAHRNHPSIIQWSIGNEIEWTYPRNEAATGFFNNMEWSGNYFWEVPPHSIDQIKEKLRTLPKGKYDIGETAKKLARWTKELDTTRYVIANCILPTVSYESGYTDVLDIIGYSYRRVIYDYGHTNYPNKPIMGTENLVQWHEWKAIMERPFISGTFLWTGIDYLGESNERWPSKGIESGMLDFAGFEKPSYYMMKSLWNNKPSIHMVTQTLEKSINKIDKTTGNLVAKNPKAWETAIWFWHPVTENWNYNTNEMIAVEIYSNCDEVELFLNNKSLGTKKLIDFVDRIYKWAVPYKDGTLVAKGKKDGKLIETKLITTTEPASILLSVDKKELKADGYEVAHIVAQLVDKDGNPVRNENTQINFSVKGDAKVLGIDTGSVDNVQDFQSNKIITDKGRCLFIIQSTRKASEIKISATGENLTSNQLSIITN